MQHWDDPGNQGMAMSYDDAPNPVATTITAAEEEYDDEEEESRELSHGEIWDDSALIDAWNSAAAEYEVCSLTPTAAMGVTDRMHDCAQAFHGPGKKWKEEPVTRSPLYVAICYVLSLCSILCHSSVAGTTSHRRRSKRRKEN